MVVEFRYGQMDPGMMGFGEVEWPMDMEDLSMPKETFTKETGPKIRLMDMVFILIITEADMKDSGSKISSTESESNNGLMVPNTKANINKE